MTRKFSLQVTLTLAAGVALAHSARAQSPLRSTEIAPVYRVPAMAADSSPAMPGTLANNSTPANLKPQPFPVRVEADSLPSWVTAQPLSYLRYGAAPAVVTLHLGRKEKAHQD
ncbi:MAG: hypothetical protein JO270_05680 [Acidobacteriaceae bacterium]|nr:hypothetical protein [Acidobacteriaceae bacterium]MBV8569978.1 hypothetical protein [Acidobacteriaceae bacterium]